MKIDGRAVMGLEEMFEHVLYFIILWGLLWTVVFSSLYSTLMLILFTLILRGVAFEFRGKVESPGWRRLRGACIFT